MIYFNERESDRVSYGERNSWVLDSNLTSVISDWYWDGRSNERDCHPKRKSWKDVPEYVVTVGGLLDLGWTWTDVKEMISSLCQRIDEERLHDCVRPFKYSDWKRHSKEDCAKWMLPRYRIENVLQNYRIVAMHLFYAMRIMQRPISDFVIDMGGIRLNDGKNIGVMKLINGWGNLNF